MIGVYLRVSTADQHTESQRAEIETYLADNFPGQRVTWFDETISGRFEDRPGFLALTEAIARGRVRRVVTWAVDRLGRDAGDLLAFLLLIRRHGVKLHAISGPLRDIDADSPMGMMVFSFLAVFAEKEAQDNAERTRRGMRAARSAGKHVGRPRLATATVVAELSLQGLTPAEIAKQLGTSEATIYALRPTASVEVTAERRARAREAFTALQAADGDASVAARALNISRPAFARWLAWTDARDCEHPGCPLFSGHPGEHPTPEKGVAEASEKPAAIRTAKRARAVSGKASLSRGVA